MGIRFPCEFWQNTVVQTRATSYFHPKFWYDLAPSPILLLAVLQICCICVSCVDSARSIYLNSHAVGSLCFPCLYLNAIVSEWPSQNILYEVHAYTSTNTLLSPPPLVFSLLIICNMCTCGGVYYSFCFLDSLWGPPPSS